MGDSQDSWPDTSHSTSGLDPNIDDTAIKVKQESF